MIELAVSAVIAVAILGGCYLAGRYLHANAQQKVSMEELAMRREAQQYAHLERVETKVIAELGRQIRGAEVYAEPATEEEAEPNALGDPTAWWNEPGDQTDPTDDVMPDPDRELPPDMGAQNLG